MEENYDEAPTDVPEDAEQIQTTGSGLSGVSGGSGVFSGLSGMSDLEGEPLANQPSTDAESSPSVMEARSMEETGSQFTAGTQPSTASPALQYAVAVSPEASAQSRTMSPYAVQLLAFESEDNMTTPSMPSLPGAGSGEPSPTSAGSPGFASATSAAYQPAASPSRNSRRTSDAAAKARVGRSGATTPGAIAVQPSQPVATPQPPVMSQAEQDAMAKARGARPSRLQTEPQPMITPGAVAVQPSQPVATPQPPVMSQAEQDAMAKARGARPSRLQTEPQPMITPGAVAVQPSQPVATQPPVMSQAEQDAMAKARGARPSRLHAEQQPQQPMITPGAVAVQPSPPVATTQASVMSQAEEDAIAKARGARPSRRQTQQQPPVSPRSQPMPTQAQLDAEAKARARGSAAAMSLGATPPPHQIANVDPMQVEDRGAMDEMARRREERAQARAERLGVQSTPVGAVSVASTQSTRETRKMERASVPTSPRTTTSSGSQATTSFANMSEDERQRRYDAKMAQANPQTQEDQKHDIQPTSNKLQVPTSEKSMVVSNMSQEERERRYDMKMSQVDQQNSDNKEKRSTSAGPEDDIYGRTQPASMRSPGMPDKIDEFDLMDSSMPATTSADRGISTDVEYGQSNENELAVAIAIDEEEEEEEKFYAYAVEFDPDSKPPIYQNRRCRLYGIVGTVCFIVLVVLLSVTIVVTGKSSDGYTPTLAPTASPTTARDNVYRKQFASIVGDKVYEPGTPHYSAMNWIVNEDPMQMEATDPNILQRFMMAFLWFHTTDNGNSPWISCNPPKKGEDDTCVALEFNRGQNDSISYVPRPGGVRWLSGQDECTWEGILCQGGTAVLGFNLIGFNLTGTLPTELVALDLLQGISVPYNQLTGTIPSEYASLRNLIQFEVHGNHLTGSIPVEFFEQGTMSLQNFNVGENLLSGKLDTRIGLMTDLKGLHIFENNLMGSFPTEVGNLRYLSFIRANDNKFAGPLPTELGSLRQLSEFWFDGNQFSGTIPSELGQLARLQDLRIAGNRFGGSIPDEIFNLSKLTWLALDDMQLTGTLSTLVGQLTDLTALKVSTNQLTGTIPTEIQNMFSLGLAWFHLNQFTGSVPSAICSLRSPVGLQILQADCYPDGSAPNPCICCTACCDRDTEICTKTGL